nr:MAG TPA: hypothetical protein [Caudoviricetes sp.]
MSNSLSRFSPTNVWDSAPEGSLGLALVPSGGAYTVEATSSVGGGNVPKIGESDTSWQETATAKGKWVYRRYNGLLLVKPAGDYSQPPMLTAGNNTIFQIPSPYRDGIQTTIAPIYKNIGNELTHDGSYIKIEPGGNVVINAKSASIYVIPTVVASTGLS